MVGAPFFHCVLQKAKRGVEEKCGLDGLLEAKGMGGGEDASY